MIAHLIAQITDDCPGCVFSANHIRNSHVTCCGSKRLDAVIYSATVVSSADVSLDKIKVSIEEWIARVPELHQYNITLKVSNVIVQTGTDNVYADCSDSSASTSQNGNRNQNNETSTILDKNNETSPFLYFVLAIIAILLLLIFIAILVCIIQRYTKKKKDDR